MLENKTIILGVTGCIAAYKSAEIVRSLKKLGADVWVVMTNEATKLISPLTFRALSGNPVITDLFGEELSNIPIPHIALTKKADLLLIAPATANILAKAAQGIADDPLSTIILSAKCPILFAPAMNTAMWENEATRDNVSKLKLRGSKFIGPDTGPLACGDEGIGKLSSIEEIVGQAIKALVPNQDLIGIRVIVTAGPTRENIDPVRYISNRSSGKMGYAMASEAARRGAIVSLISGPTDLTAPKAVEFVSVETAEEMFAAVEERFGRSDMVIMAAAVGDFKPAKESPNKIKKSSGKASIEVEQTKDILKGLGKKKSRQILVGFALETDNPLENAKTKLREKNLDLIVANSPSAFGSDKNKVALIGSNEGVIDLPEMNKNDVAQKVLTEALKLLGKKELPLNLCKTINE